MVFARIDGAVMMALAVGLMLAAALPVLVKSRRHTGLRGESNSAPGFTAEASEQKALEQRDGLLFWALFVWLASTALALGPQRFIALILLMKVVLAVTMFNCALACARAAVSVWRREHAHARLIVTPHEGGAGVLVEITCPPHAPRAKVRATMELLSVRANQVEDEGLQAQFVANVSKDCSIVHGSSVVFACNFSDPLLLTMGRQAHHFWRFSALRGDAYLLIHLILETQAGPRDFYWR